MKVLFAFLFVCMFFESNSQNNYKDNTIYIYEESPVITTELNGKSHYYLTIKSKDSSFNYDSYKFIFLAKQLEFDKFEPAVGKKVDLDTIKINRIRDFNNLKPWEIHHNFSLNKNISLVLRKGSDIKVFTLKYKGTEKNVQLMRMGQ